jgi:hypothetical protein
LQGLPAIEQEGKVTILFDSTIGDDGLRVLVSRHEDEPASPILSIERHGMKENVFKDGMELRLVGEAIRLAGIQWTASEGL